jgi:hypothetical protein
VTDGIYNIIYDVYAQRDGNHQTDIIKNGFEKELEKSCHLVNPHKGGEECTNMYREDTRSEGSN